MSLHTNIKILLFVKIVNYYKLLTSLQSLYCYYYYYYYCYYYYYENNNSNNDIDKLRILVLVLKCVSGIS